MKKISIVLLLLYSNLYAISGFTYWWNVNVSKDTVTAVKLKNNYDSIKNWSTRISDTLNRGVVHFNPGPLNKTNVVKYVNIDTIRSNPNIDSISGNTYLESVSTPSAGITRANIDSSDHRVITADSATIPVLKGAKTIRDTSTFTGGAYFAGIARFAGTLYAPVVDIDSMVGDVKFGGSVGQYRGSDYIKFDYNQGALPGYPIEYYPTIKSSGNSIYLAAFDRYVGVLGFLYNGSFLWLYDSTAGDYTIKLNSKGMSYVGPLTTSTINTGNGDCELYPDSTGKAGTATNQSGGTVSATTGTFSTGITIAGGSQLTAFSKGTFVCSLYVNNNTEFVGYGTVQYQVVDSVVTLRFPYISGTITTSGTNAVNVRNVPVALRSSKTEQYVPVTTYENGGYGIGLFQAKSSSTYFAFTTSAVGSPATGTFTVNRCVVQYFL